MAAVPVRLSDGASSWCRLPVPGDGNCAFYALSSSLNYLGYRDHDLRTQVRIGRSLRERILADRDDEWNTFIKERGFEGLAPSLESLRPPHVYVDDWLLNFVAWLLGLRVIVLTGTERLEFGDGDLCVTLAWFQASEHFESVVCRLSEPRDAAEDDAIREIVRRIASKGVRRSPGNAKKIAEAAVAPCHQGFTGVFLHGAMSL
jgi:hypothetical protein